MPRTSRKFQPEATQQPAVFVYSTAIYTRISLEDIRKKVSDSIGTQKATLMSYLQSQPDMQLYGVYEDVNYTGTNFNRPGFTRMIEDIQAGNINCVVVKDLSRFGRSFEETGHYLERVFPFLQVRFVAVTDSFDSLTATVDESTLMVPLKNLVNEIYAKDISKKVSSSFKAKQQRGEFCGAFAPYGYIKQGSRFVVDEEAATIVKQIYAWRLEGMGIVAIVQKLNSLGILPPSKHRFERGITKTKKHENTLFWYKSTVKRILSYTAYTGDLALGRYKSNFLKGGHITAVDSREWIVFKDAHSAIIDAETFEAVQQMAETRKKEFNRDATNPTENIFKGLIFCGDCGKHMTRMPRRKKFSYECYVYRAVDKQACPKKVIREADLHSTLYAYIKREIDLSADMRRIISDLQKQKSYQQQLSVADKEIAALNRKLEQNRRFRGSLREDFKDGILTNEDYSTMKADYDSENEKLQKSMEELLAAKSKQNETVSQDNKWLKEFRRFESEQQLSAGMVSALVERINVYADSRIEVFLRYRDELESLQAHLSNFNEEARGWQ